MTTTRPIDVNHTLTGVVLVQPKYNGVPWQAAPSQLLDARDCWHALLDVPADSVPMWALTAATAFAPATWLLFWLRRRRNRNQRRRLGLCVNCGYNLRGNTSGRCSECGSPMFTNG